MNRILRSFVSFAFATMMFVTLSAIAHAAVGSATIYWTAPGDDSTFGRATAYQVRYSTAPLTAANFPLATAVTGLRAPKMAGSPETLVVASLPTGATYYFGIKTVDDAGNWSGLSNIVIEYLRTTDIMNNRLVAEFSRPRPNPARESTRWSYTMPLDGPMEVVAYDVTGRRVRHLANGWSAAGAGTLDWNLQDDSGRNVPPGTYLVHARFGGQEWTRRVVVVR